MRPKIKSTRNEISTHHKRNSAYKMFTFFTENNLVSPNQSGFRPGDFCVNQLLATTHEIYKSFDEGFEVRRVFLDISKGMA